MSSEDALIGLGAIAQNAAIGVVAPASFAREDRVDAGVTALRSLGFSVKLAAHALARGPLFFAGTQEERIAGLHSAFVDSATQVLMSVRGGYGSNYLLDKIDLELVRAHPKPFFAYSDLTGLQLYLLDRLGLPAFHGPMLAADFYLQNGVHLPSFRAALAGEAYRIGALEGLRILKRGSAQGTLYGGCISMLVSLLGTPWEPRTEGKLLFLEDVGAKPYQVDRMLWQLEKAGKFRGVRGIVFGEMLECRSPGAEDGILEKVILSALREFDGPIAIGLRSGHVSRQNVTLTFGVEAELTAEEDAQLAIGARN
jgi:muramoyltetrapeptide carboxypeptidase